MLYIVMELCTGGDLFDVLIDIGHLSEASTAKDMCHIAQGPANQPTTFPWAPLCAASPSFCIPYVLISLSPYVLSLQASSTST